MELNGSKTQRNLRAAFTGESMARNKYLFFADKARKEGLDEVANMFESLALNEATHARLLYEKGIGLGNSVENLQTAIKGEYSEWSDMYPSFAKTAREEGFEDIAKMFESISRIERDHEYRFLQMLMKLTKKGETPKEKKTVTVEGYRCVFCGAVFENRQDVCDVCEAIGSFEPTTYEKEID